MEYFTLENPRNCSFWSKITLIPQILVQKECDITTTIFMPQKCCRGAKNMRPGSLESLGTTLNILKS